MASNSFMRLFGLRCNHNQVWFFLTILID